MGGPWPDNRTLQIVPTGARSLDITRAYVRAFFDQHLWGRPQALLDQPSPRYPEITFCFRGTEA